MPSESHDAESAGARLSRTSIAVRVLLAVVVSVFFVAFFATRLRFSEIAGVLRHVHVTWLLLGAGVLGVANVMRAERFRLLDRNQHDISYWWVTTQVYNFATSTLPGGVGEMATAYFFRRSTTWGSWAGSLRLLVVARLIDLATLLSIFVAAMYLLGLAWSTPSGAISSSIAAVLAVAALVVLTPRAQAFVLSLLMRFLTARSPLIARVRTTLGASLEVSKTRDLRTFILVAVWSAGMGLLSCGAVTVLLNGFGSHLNLVQSCASYGLYVLLQLVPLQGIAGVGSQSARWVIALSLVGVAPHRATLDAVALYVYLYGIIALWALFAVAVGVSLRWTRRRVVLDHQPR